MISKRTKRFQKQQNIVAKRGGLAYYIFKAIPKIHHKFHSFLLNLHFRWKSKNGDRTTWQVYGVIPWYQHEPRQQLALSTTLQNGSLITSETTCQEPSFFRCFSSWQKIEANNCYLQHLRTKLKSVNIGKWFIIHNQPSSRKSYLKYYHLLASNFSA